MPGPVTYVTDAISNGRRESLDTYVKQLLGLPDYISKCNLVRELFAPRDGDFELDPRAMGEDYRLSGVSQQSSTPDSVGRTASRQSSQGQMNGANGYPQNALSPAKQRSGHQRNQSSAQGPNGVQPGQHGPRNQLDYQPQTAINRQPSSLTQASGTSSGTHQSSAANNSSTNVGGVPPPLKIKVFFEDDLIAIRVPHDITFDQLKAKLKDRLKVQEDIVVQYKDEPSGTYSEILNDREFDEALERNQKLTLYVGYAS